MKEDNILNYFQGDLYINEQMNTFGKYIKDDSEIKGIHPGDIKSDKCQIYNFRKKSGFKNHCSQILNGVRKEPKCVFEDNLETYNKSYFNGKSAIEIVKEVIGCQYDDVESKMIREWFDPKYGNNNMGIPDDPQLKFLFMKRRAQENESKSHQLKEINKPKNIHEKKNIQQKMNINKKNEKDNDIEKPEENIIPLNEEEQTKKENAKTKKKIGEKKENKNEDKSKKEVNLGLFNKLSDLMSGLNNFKKKKI